MIVKIIPLFCLLLRYSNIIIAYDTHTHNGITGGKEPF